MKIFTQKVYFSISSLPAITLISFYSLILKIYLQQNALPVIYKTELNNSGFEGFCSLIIGLSLILSYIFLPAWFILTTLGIRKKIYPKKVWIAGGCLFLVSFITLFILMRLDPGNLWSWFFD